MNLRLKHACGVQTNFNGLCALNNLGKIAYSSGSNLFLASLQNPSSIQIFRGHSSTICSMCSSKTSNMIVSAQNGQEPDICVWDGSNGQLRLRMVEHENTVRAMAFSDDGNILLTSGEAFDDKTVIWDMSNGNIIQILPNNPNPTLAIASGGNVKDSKGRDTSNYLFCSIGGATLNIWQIDPYEGLTVIDKVTSDGRGALVREFTNVSFSHNCMHILCTSTSGDIVIACVRSKKFLLTLPCCRGGTITVTPFPWGFAVGGGDGSIVKFSSEFQEFGRGQLPCGISSAIAIGNMELMAITDDGSTYRINLEREILFCLVTENHVAPIKCVCFCRSNSDRVVTGSSDGVVKVWDLSDELTAIHSFQIKSAQAPQCVEFIQNLVISGWGNGSIRCHSLSETSYAPTEVWKIDDAHLNGVTAMVGSRNFKFVVTGGEDGDIRLWELRSRELISVLKQHTSRITDLKAFDHDESTLVSSSRDRSIMHWSLKDERRISCLSQRMGGINGMCVMDPTTVISIGQERKISYWNLNSPSTPISCQLSTPEQQADHEAFTNHLSVSGADEPTSIAISNNKSWFVTGGTGPVIRLWSSLAKCCTQSVLAHSAKVNKITFSENNHWIATVGDDGNLFVWEPTGLD